MRKLLAFSVVFTILGIGAVIVNGRPYSSTLGGPVVLISEEDGDPISRLRLLQVPNDSLTDNGGGILSLDTSSGDANAVDVAISTTALQALIDLNIAALARVGIDTDTLKGLIDNNAAELVAVGVSTQALQDAIDSGFDTVGLSTQTNADNILTNAVDISTTGVAVDTKVSKSGDTMTGTLIVPEVDVTTTSYQQRTGGERAFSKIQIAAGSSNRLHTRFDFNEGVTSRAGYMVTPLGISSTSFQGRLDYALSACDPDEFDCATSPFGLLRLDMRSPQRQLRIGTQFLNEDVNGNTCAPINLMPSFSNVFLTLDDCFVEDDLSSKFIYSADFHEFLSPSGSMLTLSTTTAALLVPLFLEGNLDVTGDVNVIGNVDVGTGDIRQTSSTYMLLGSTRVVINYIEQVGTRNFLAVGITPEAIDTGRVGLLVFPTGTASTSTVIQNSHRTQIAVIACDMGLNPDCSNPGASLAMRLDQRPGKGFGVLSSFNSRSDQNGVVCGETQLLGNFSLTTSVIVDACDDAGEGDEVRLRATTVEVRASTIQFKDAAGTPRLHMDSDGNWGLGTTNPRTLFEIFGGTLTVPGSGNAAGPEYSFAGDTDTGFFSPFSGILAFSNRGSESMRIDANGNVGINTVSPETKFDVNGNAQFGSGVDKSTFTATADLVMGGFWRPESKTRAELEAITPSQNDVYACSNCLNAVNMVIGTTTISGFDSLGIGGTPWH